MGANFAVSPVFIKKSLRHAHVDTTTNYLHSTLGQALRSNDALCGNEPGEGWDVGCTGRKRSPQPHLPTKFIKPAPQTPPFVKAGEQVQSSASTESQEKVKGFSTYKWKDPRLAFVPASHWLKQKSQTLASAVSETPASLLATSSTAVSGGSASSRRSETLEQLSANGVSVARSGSVVEPSKGAVR